MGYDRDDMAGRLLGGAATTDLMDAARLLGMGRTKAYALARQGGFPVPLVRVGQRLRVPTAPLLAMLRGGSPANLRAGRAEAPFCATRVPTVGEWLTSWLAGRRGLALGTVRSYEAHIRRYLVPHLGELALDALRVEHIGGLFDAVIERNGRIQELRGSADPGVRVRARGLRVVKPATMHRIRATLRAALNDAMPHLIQINPARHVELPPARSPKALVWTDGRVRRWRATGQVPSPVMVWTPTQTGAFLAHAGSERLYPLYHLIVHTGLRRGEACGLHWEDVDLDGATMMVRWQLTQLGWATHLGEPKTVASEAVVALDAATVTVLRTWRRRQQRERVDAGDGWTDSRFVFTRADGAPWHPAEVTRSFKQSAGHAGLPPVRLHDLRHGAATMALAAGVDMKVVQVMLRHSSIAVTANTYTGVLPELAHAAAETIAATLRRHPQPGTAAA